MKLKKRLRQWRRGLAAEFNQAPTVFVEQGNDPSTAILAFTGLEQRLMMPTFDFFQVSELLEFSRILCRDEHGIWYHKGLSPETPDYPSSVAWLLEILSELAANTWIAVGTSSGGYAALLYGHLLRVDTVHAFSPHTCLERGHAFETRGLKNAGRAELYDRLEAYPLAAREFFDLAEVLKHHNGKTKFFVHYCSSSERDRIDCERLRGLSGVTVTPHPCKGHNVALHLAKRRLLMDLLKPENQENIEALLSRRIE